MNDLQLPFAHLNLRRNPFGEVPPEHRGRLAVVDLDPFLDRLTEPGFVVEFLGESGRGKTTHMRALWDHFRDAPFVKVTNNPRQYHVPRGPVVFIDEAQFLMRWHRRRTFRQNKTSFVVGTHESLASTYERHGLAYESVEVGGTDPDSVAEMIERRVEWARRGPDEVPKVSDRAVTALIERHGDDLRAIEHHLYEIFQELEEICDVEVHHLR